MKDFYKENKRVIILILALSCILALVVIVNILKKPKENSEKNYGNGADNYQQEDLSMWDMNSWNSGTDSFSFYFKNGLLYFSDFNFEVTPINIFLCFYGDDSSKFVSVSYSGAEDAYIYGTEPVLRRVPEQQVYEIENWRSSHTPFATEKINNSEEDYYFYALTWDDFDFRNNMLPGTTYSFDPQERYQEGSPSTFLQTTCVGKEYHEHYGKPGPQLMAYANRCHASEDYSYEMLDLDTYNYGASYMIVSQSLYDEFNSCQTVDDKISFVKNNILNKSSNYTYVEIAKSGVSYNTGNWAVHLDNAQTIESLGDSFSPILGSFGASINEYQPQPVTLDEYLMYCDMCSLYQAKTLTEFINEYIYNYPNIMK